MTPKSEKRSMQDSSRTGMANQNPGQKSGQQTQKPGDKSRQQGDTMDPNHRGGHRPDQGKQPDAGH